MGASNAVVSATGVMAYLAQVAPKLTKCPEFVELNGTDSLTLSSIFFCFAQNFSLGMRLDPLLNVDLIQM